MAKMDIKSAYRLVPVHPQDRLLLGMRWNKRIFVDNMLHFGLRSALKLFTAIADALEWVIEQRKVAWVYHYLDFITLGEPGQDPQHMCGVEGYSGLEQMCGPECLPNISGH